MTYWYVSEYELPEQSSHMHIKFVSIYVHLRPLLTGEER